MVYRVHKALYGVKQTPRVWKKKIYRFLMKLGFNKCMIDYDVYVHEITLNMLLICMYVNDLLVIGSNTSEINRFNEHMMS